MNTASTNLEKIPVGTRVVYKHPMCPCYLDNKLARVLYHGDRSSQGIPHMIQFDDGKKIPVFPDEITPTQQ